MSGYTVEKSQLKRYNCNTLYTIGGIKMDMITQSMLDAFQNDFSLSFNDSAILFLSIFQIIVLLIIYMAPEYLLSQKGSLIEYLKTDNVLS